MFWPFGHDKAEEEDQKSSEQMLYRSAQSSLRSGNYRDAITKLQKLEARFPFGRYAEQAQLELIYANFMSYQPEAARSAADRFIRLHPQHPNVDYAYYIKGLAEFNKDRGSARPLRRNRHQQTRPDFRRAGLRPISPNFSNATPTANMRPTRASEWSFSSTCSRNTKSTWRKFYMRRGAYVAAANRAREVVEHYSQSQSVDDALAISTEANWRFGIARGRKRLVRILAINDPQYPAFDDNGRFVFRQQTFDRDRSWLNMMTFGVIDRPPVPPPITIDTPLGIDVPAHVLPIRVPPAKPKKPWWRLFG